MHIYVYVCIKLTYMPSDGVCVECTYMVSGYVLNSSVGAPHLPPQCIMVCI